RPGGCPGSARVTARAGGDGVPVGGALPTPAGAGELHAGPPAPSRARARARGTGMAGAPRSPRPGGRLATGAVGRRTAASGHRPGAVVPSRGAALGRAHQRARPRAQARGGRIRGRRARPRNSSGGRHPRRGAVGNARGHALPTGRRAALPAGRRDGLRARPGVPLQLPEGGGRGLPVALFGGVVVVLLPLVPEPVAGFVLVLLRVPVSLP